MSKLRRKKPKVKMRSYGSGEKLPVVKSGKDFYLADEKFDSKGHGEFVGQTTGKLEGPSKRAIKGKGKKSGNVRVSSKLEGGDPIFLEDTSPMKMKNDYSSMKSMGQAVARWTSPNKLTGKASPMEEEGLTKSYYDKNKRKEQKAKYKDIDKKEAKEKGVGYKSDKKIERQTKKDLKKDYKESEEGKEATAKKREKATDITQAIGRAMAAAGGTTVKTPSKTASQKGKEQRDKEKKDKEKEKVKDASAKSLEEGVVGAKT